MANRLRDLKFFDMTGGLNTRKSSFQLAPNEVPEVLNMDFDPRGGVVTRKGWSLHVNEDVVTTGVEPWVNLNGSGEHIIVADDNSFDVTGDLQLVAGVRVADWSVNDRLLFRHSSEEGSFAIVDPGVDGYIWYIATSGRIIFRNIPTSGTMRHYESTVSLDGIATPNTNWWVGISYDVNNGAGASSCRFWQSSTGPNGPWTELGVADTDPNTANIVTPNGPLTIGAQYNGANSWTGRVLHAEIRDGIGASNTMTTANVLFELDTSTDLASSQVTDSSFTTTSGDTAVLNGSIGMLTAVNWNPRVAYLHENSAGVKYLLVANNGVLRSSTDAGSWSTITNSDLVADPHLASFAAWGDNVYVAQGRTKQGLRTTGTGAGTLLTASGTGQWQNDYAAAEATHMPKAEHAATLHGYMFVANTQENAVNFPNRLRWSHPNKPQSWAEVGDFIDITKGGSKITALVPFTDRLMIFKTDSVWALFGHNADSWELVEVTNDNGCLHPQAIAVGSQALYFFGEKGVFVYTGNNVVELSYQIRDMFEKVNQGALNNVWLGWQNRRLWVAIPSNPDGDLPVTEPEGLVVFDPQVGRTGAWTRYQGAENHPIAPFVDHTSSADSPPLAVCRLSPEVVELDAAEEAVDDMHGSPSGFTSYVRTSWLDGGEPTLRKSWRRPDYVFRNLDGIFTLQVESFIDFNPERKVRESVVEIDAFGNPGMWGDGDLWGNGEWASSQGGLEAQLIRGKTLGAARAVALRFVAPPGAKWGLNALVPKFVPRRLR